MVFYIFILFFNKKKVMYIKNSILYYNYKFTNLYIYNFINFYVFFFIYREYYFYFLNQFSKFFIKGFCFMVYINKLFAFFNVNFYKMFYSLYYVELFVDGLYYRVKYFSKYNIIGFIIGYNHYVLYKLPLYIKAAIHMRNRRFFLYSFEKNHLINTAVEIVNLKYPNLFKGKGLRLILKTYRRKIIEKKNNMKYFVKKEDLRQKVNSQKAAEVRNSYEKFFFLGKTFKYYFNVKLMVILRSIYGISIKRFVFFFSSLVCSSINRGIVFIDADRFYKLQVAFRSLVLDYALKKQDFENIQNKIDLRLYAGIRFLRNLPLRGQRSKTNAQTMKKKYLRMVMNTYAGQRIRRGKINKMKKQELKKFKKN